MWQSVAAAPAFAYEDELTLGVGLGYAYAAREGGPHSGAAAALEASLGLGQSWSTRAFVGYSLHPAKRSLSKLNAAVELVYVVDILEIVPYFGAGVDVLGSWGRATDGARADFGVHPVVGLDWLFSRDLIIGLEARPVFVLTRWEREPLSLNVLLTGSLVLEL
ncbi:MAG: hypothetical protein ABW321_09890 [Polyangiales bacterium]